MARPRMLFLCALFPLPIRSGTQQRTMGLLGSFAERFDIDLLTLAADPGWEAHLGTLERLCRRVVPVVPDNRRDPVRRIAYKVAYWLRHVLAADSSDRFYNTVPAVNRQLRAMLAQAPDVVFAQYWFWDASLFAASGLKVIDANDVQSQRVERLLQRTRHPLDRLQAGRLLRRYRERERGALRAADVVVATTAADRDVFATWTGPETRHRVTPTGIDTSTFAPRGDAGEADHVAFYGALSNPMNRDALEYLRADVWPRVRARHPAARLTLVGAFPTPEARAWVSEAAEVSLTGYVEDIREPLARARVAVLPLRFGYGIRGRVYELLALGVPVVATPVAVHGMGLESGDGLLLEEEPQRLADAVVRLLEDDALHAELAQRGRAWAEANVSLEATYGALARELQDLVQGATAAPAAGAGGAGTMRA